MTDDKQWANSSDAPPLGICDTCQTLLRESDTGPWIELYTVKKQEQMSEDLGAGECFNADRKSHSYGEHQLAQSQGVVQNDHVSLLVRAFEVAFFIL